MIFHHVCEVTRGATPGKRLLHLRVARLEDGELPTPRQAAARGVIGIFEFGVIACIAVNFWLFRLGVFWGILGLNVTKHVVTAYLCQVLGVDRQRPSETPRVISQAAPEVPVA